MRKSAVERLREAKRKKQGPIQLTFEGLLLLLLDGDREPEQRVMLPTQRDFIYDPARIKAYKGPAGCAKTSTICAAGLMRALFQPGSKGLVSRYDYNDLMDTTKLRMEDMLARLPQGVLLDRDKSPPEKWWIRPIVGNGDDDEVSEITFMGLKDNKGSYEFDWEIVDEADECDEAVIRLLNSRLRNRVKGQDLPYALMLAFNPPDKTHWLYPACTGFDHQERRVGEPWMKLFEPQPSENTRNLPKDYYEQLASGLTEDQKRRLVDGEWGGTFPGQPVYREFKYGFHTRDLSTKYDPYSTLYRFWDFGYNNPACIFAQMDHEGRLLVLREKLAQKIEIGPFAELVKGETEKHFPGHRDIRDYGDPAVRQKKDTGSTLVELGKVGITMMYRLMSLDDSIRQVRMAFSKLIAGEPYIQIDPRHAPVLTAAMRGGYHLDKTGTKPVKDDYYDHAADAFRYGVINVQGGIQQIQTQNWPTNIAVQG